MQYPTITYAIIESLARYLRIQPVAPAPVRVGKGSAGSARGCIRDGRRCGAACATAVRRRNLPHEKLVRRDREEVCPEPGFPGPAPLLGVGSIYGAAHLEVAATGKLRDIVRNGAPLEPGPGDTRGGPFPLLPFPTSIRHVDVVPAP